jgi:hypothetical protein
MRALLLRYVLIVSACLLACGGPAMGAESLARSLSRTAPSANPRAIALAVEAAACATARLGGPARHLALIDYSLPSTQPRLWVFDLDRRKLLFEEWVAHGRNSGENYARWFSNNPDSLTSSLGLFRTHDTYDGDNGYSLRLAGLEPGINDNAESRAIVMHGAPYVDRHFIRTEGRLGRSHGCPAVRPEVAHAVIDALKDGQYLFAYYPDRKWLASSAYLGCTSPRPFQNAKKRHKTQPAASAMTQASSGVASAIR